LYPLALLGRLTAQRHRGPLPAYGTEEQKHDWLPKLASGEVVSAIAMTEPGTGSDLQNVSTKAIRDGEDYVVNGAKTFITNGFQADMVLVVELTHEYTTSRTAFGKPLFAFQNTKFVMAEVATEARVTRSFVDGCLELHVKGQLDIPTAAMAKLWASERAQKVVDKCLQLHGGYGYMNEYPIARAWADLRVSQIYAGTSEIMKEIIARSMPAPS
jgi:alkylation response protein AidB-like acyl-CoA dehydrogenase